MTPTSVWPSFSQNSYRAVSGNLVRGNTGGRNMRHGGRASTVGMVFLSSGGRGDEERAQSIRVSVLCEPRSGLCVRQCGPDGEHDVPDGESPFSGTALSAVTLNYEIRFGCPRTAEFADGPTVVRAGRRGRPAGPVNWVQNVAYDFAGRRNSMQYINGWAYTSPGTAPTWTQETMGYNVKRAVLTSLGWAYNPLRYRLRHSFDDHLFLLLDAEQRPDHAGGGPACRARRLFMRTMP